MKITVKSLKQKYEGIEIEKRSNMWFANFDGSDLFAGHTTLAELANSIESLDAISWHKMRSYMTNANLDLTCDNCLQELTNHKYYQSFVH